MSAQTAAKSRGLDLCTGPFWKKIWLFTLPIIATGLLQLLFNAADLVVVGRYAGEEALGAVGATGALINLIVNMFMGLSVGSGVMVAQGIGAKDEGMIHRTVHTSIPAALCGGVILTVVGVSLSHVFLEWMDTPAEFIDLSALYMQIYFAGMIPNLLLLMMMASIFGNGIPNMILALGVGGIGGIAKTIRNQVLSLKQKEFVESAKAMGAKDARIMYIHILPQLTSYLTVRFSSGLAGNVLSMTSLSYLGVGLDPMVASWGGMVSDGQLYLFSTPHEVLWPGVAISLTVFGFTLMGDGIRDLLDPRLR